jgi:hypothetical protein
MGERENRDYAIIAVAVCGDDIPLSHSDGADLSAMRNLNGCLFCKFDGRDSHGLTSQSEDATLSFVIPAQAGIQTKQSTSFY